jgi:cytochrome bd ubiquinol oxidase subunit I
MPAFELLAATASELGRIPFPAVDQDYLLEARQMQALSLAVHIPLVCFGIAFPAMVLFMEGLHLRTGDPVYKAIAKRWSKVMLILFAVGVVTGTILSFELGLLWPQFMESFGEVFGVAFALEGIAFFTEAIFIAIYVYGWDRLPPRAHLLSGLPIIAAGIAGALFVIGVNGWMNDPGGFELAADGTVRDVNPFAALVNSNIWHEFVHMYLAGIMVAGFIVAGVYSWAHLKGKRDRYHRAALIVPLAFACLAAPAQLIVGDWAGRTVADKQPIKLAALEGLQETTEGAPLGVGGIMIGDQVYGAIEIPNGLSLLANHDPSSTVQGLNTVPPEDRPPVAWVRNSFQVMVGIGTMLALLAAIFLVTWLRKRHLPRSRWFYRAVVVAGPAATVAMIAGWIVTEVGRQPWIVYEVMRTEQAVTGAEGVPIGYGALVAIYVGVAAIVAYMLRRLARRPVHIEANPRVMPADPARTRDEGGPGGGG